MSKNNIHVYITKQFVAGPSREHNTWPLSLTRTSFDTDAPLKNANGTYLIQKKAVTNGLVKIKIQ